MEEGNDRSQHLKNSSNHLARLKERQGFVRDRVRCVRNGATPGMFLSGPPGTGKTHLVLEACREYDQPSYLHFRGHLTLVGLIDQLASHADATHVLDDVHQILEDQKAIQILLAALGTPDDDSGTRIVRYKRSGVDEVIEFRGGVIAISNLALRSGKPRQRQLLDAIANRVHMLEFAPNSDEIAALMYEIASKGWRGSAKGKLDPATCLEVTEYVIEQSQKSDLPLDLRVLVDKSFPDRWMWSIGETDNHWRDLVRTTIQERALALPKGSTQAEELEIDRQLVKRICNKFATRAERIAAWREATRSEQLPIGKSERAFYRRKKEVESGGRS